MDPDRHSNVSSFYGSRDRRPSFEPGTALSNAPPPTTGYHQRTDSVSSSAFFNPNRLSQASADLLTGDMGIPAPRGTAGSAGYNRTSFFAPGREEPVKGGRDEEQPLRQGGLDLPSQEEGWDVYADFNNSGPRYSTAFGAEEDGYRKIPPGALKPETPNALDSEGHVELVTVPALGSEWKASELREMTKSGKREARAEARATTLRAWRLDQAGCCGIKWLTRKVLVFIIFGLAALAGIVLAFTIPRVPSFSFNNDTPLSGAKNVQFSRIPANFSFDTNLDLQIDTSSNFLPLRLQNVHAQVFELDTNTKVAEGDLGSKTFPAKAFSQLILPVRFNYTAVNASDQTWMNVYGACRNQQTVPVNESRPRNVFNVSSIEPDLIAPFVALKLRILLQLHILGLPSHPLAGTAIDGAPCPFQLPINSV